MRRVWLVIAVTRAHAGGPREPRSADLEGQKYNGGTVFASGLSVNGLVSAAHGLTHPRAALKAYRPKGLASRMNSISSRSPVGSCRRLE